MIGSINAGNAGFQQQSPASKAFEPNQAPQNPANTPKVQNPPQAVQTQDAVVNPGKTEEIAQKLALSRDQSRIDPSQIFNNSQERGSILDISV